MSEDERVSTLNDLVKAKQATNDQLERLPIQSKSIKMTNYKR